MKQERDRETREILRNTRKEADFFRAFRHFSRVSRSLSLSYCLFVALSLLLILAAITLTFESSSAAQNTSPLTLKQVEQFLEIKIEDEVIAREIMTRGVSFKVDQAILNNLIKRGAGTRTQQALLSLQERAAYTDFLDQKQNAAARMALGRDFLKRYPQSQWAAEVAAALPRLMSEVFAAAFDSFSRAPDAAKLNQLLALGADLLNQQPDRVVEVEVKTKLALATGRGMIGNFFSDLEQSKAYAGQALKLLEEQNAPPGFDQESYNRLRRDSLSVLYQCQGLYLLRQATPDAEQAIDYLTKAIELKDGPSGTDPNAFWLRAYAADLIYQKLRDDYLALPKNRRKGSTAQALCAKIAPLTGRITDDLVKVIGLSNSVNNVGSRQMHDEAAAMLKSLLATERPCLAGREDLIDEWPEKENRFAVVIGVEEYLDKSIDRFNHAAADARAMAETLIDSAGFDRDRVKLIATGEPGGGQPLRSAIFQHLVGLRSRLSQDSLLVLFFAGQCVERSGKTYLLPADAVAVDDTLLSETAISLDRVKSLIKESNAGQVVLMIDAFRRNLHTESFLRELSFDVRKQEASAFIALLATAKGGRAHESSRRKQGFFTAALTDGWRGQAANQKGEVTLKSLIEYLEAKIPQQVQQELGGDARQHPLAVVDGYDSAELVLARAESARQRAANPQSTPLDSQAAIRAARTVLIRSKTVYLKESLLETELQGRAEFKSLGMKLVGKESDADLIVDVTLPFLTWMWTYTITHRQTGSVVASGKVREITATQASPKLATMLTDNLTALRAGR